MSPWAFTVNGDSTVIKSFLTAAVLQFRVFVRSRTTGLCSKFLHNVQCTYVDTSLDKTSASLYYILF